MEWWAWSFQIQNDSAIKQNGEWINETLMNYNDRHKVLFALMHFLVDKGVNDTVVFLPSFLPSSPPPHGSIKLDLASFSDSMEIWNERSGIKMGVVRWSLEPSQGWPLTSKHERHPIALQKTPDLFLTETGKGAPECWSSCGSVLRRSDRLVRLARLNKEYWLKKKKKKNLPFAL